MTALFKKKAIQKALSKELTKKPHTILLVDDEEHNLTTLSDLLVDHYEILTAQSGFQALELLETNDNNEKIHLIISDQRMPKMSGVEFLKASLEIVPKAKRIILTGYTDVKAIIDSINEARIYKFITKPFNHVDMMLTVDRALRSYSLEEQNEKLLRELRDLNRSLEEKVAERTQKLQELNASKDRFFSIIAHDLRAPLHNFVLSTDTLVDKSGELTNPSLQRLAGSLQGSALGLQRLLQNLLDWSRLQMGSWCCKPETHFIQALVQETIELISESIRQKNLTINVEIDPALEASLDKGFVSTIIRNLLTNSVKFTPSNGRISITAKAITNKNQDLIEISVTDTGRGLQPEELQKLFRIDTKHTTPGTEGERGTGLGLTLCKSLAKSHGGDLYVESTYGEGSRFFLQIPRDAHDAAYCK